MESGQEVYIMKGMKINKLVLQTENNLQYTNLRIYDLLVNETGFTDWVVFEDLKNKDTILIIPHSVIVAMEIYKKTFVTINKTE